MQCTSIENIRSGSDDATGAAINGSFFFHCYWQLLLLLHVRGSPWNIFFPSFCTHTQHTLMRALTYAQRTVHSCGGLFFKQLLCIYASAFVAHNSWKKYVILIFCFFSLSQNFWFNLGPMIDALFSFLECLTRWWWFGEWMD